MNSQSDPNHHPDQDALNAAEPDPAAYQSLRPEVAAKIVSWRPRNLDLRHDPAAVDILLPAVKSWVVAVQPSTPQSAQLQLWASTRMALWWFKHTEDLDLETMLTLHNAVHFAMIVNGDRSANWQEVILRVLRQIGPVLNPSGGWPLVAPIVFTRHRLDPYPLHQEEFFAQTAMLPGRVNRAARLWLIVATFGAGLSGSEASAATVADLTERDDGRFVVTVHGGNARKVPIRDRYTAMTREAIEASDGVNFFRGSSPRAASTLARRFPNAPSSDGNGVGLLLVRARKTWLMAHLTAPGNTRMDALSVVAGPTVIHTFHGLLRHIGHGISAQEAVEQALDV